MREDRFERRRPVEEVALRRVGVERSKHVKLLKALSESETPAGGTGRPPRSLNPEVIRLCLSSEQAARRSVQAVVVLEGVDVMLARLSRATEPRGVVSAIAQLSSCPYNGTDKEISMTVKDRRREVRISAADDDLLAEAAGLAGVSVSEFLLERALADAVALVEAHRTIRLSDDSYDAFLEALDAPARPPKDLVAQARRARRLKRAD